MSTKKEPAKEAKKPQAKKVNTPEVGATVPAADETQVPGTDAPVEDEITAPVESDAAAGETIEPAGDAGTVQTEKVTLKEVVKTMKGIATAVDKVAADLKKKRLDEAMKKRAKEVFKNHSVDVLYMTQDVTAFLEPQYAHIHAGSLESQEVTTIERREIQ
jgi:hypothetical protein